MPRFALLIMQLVVPQSFAAETCAEPYFPDCVIFLQETDPPRLFAECRDKLEQYDLAIDAYEQCVNLEAAQAIRRAKERRNAVHEAWACHELDVFFMFCASPDQPSWTPALTASFEGLSTLLGQ